MDLINENENLIHCLKELRDELKIEELEKAIRNQEFNDTSYEELIYKKNQELARLFNRIYAVHIPGSAQPVSTHNQPHYTHLPIRRSHWTYTCPFPSDNQELQM